MNFPGGSMSKASNPQFPQTLAGSAFSKKWIEVSTKEIKCNVVMALECGSEVERFWALWDYRVPSTRAPSLSGHMTSAVSFCVTSRPGTQTGDDAKK